MNPFVRIYPVFNGTCVLLKTSSSKTILIDCKITKLADDPNDQDNYDVKNDLLDHLERDDRGRPFVDLFVLTHPDKDHCHGFSNHFYCGQESNYTKKDKEESRILIDEMWVTKLIYGEVCDDAETIRDEVIRRRKLYGSDSRDRETSYNRLTMIGYDTDETFVDCPFYVPGQLVEDFAGKYHSDVEIFIHNPFKKSLIESEANDDRNAASIVCQYKLKRTDSNKYLNLLEGGDADHYRWAMIKAKTEEKDRESRLEYDILIASHHCSWTFYGDVPYAKNVHPQQSSKDLVQAYKDRNGGSYIVASSKLIIDNDDNPPHYPAKKEFIDDLGDKDRFICTSEYPTKADPKPIHFELEATRWSLKKESTPKETRRAATAYATSTKASSYGPGI